MTWDDTFGSLCNLRCKAAGVGDTICLEVCGEAGVDIDKAPNCGEILEALGFERPADGDDEPGGCTNAGGHEFISTGTNDGGDDDRYHGEGRSYCIHCNADGDG